MHCHLFCLPLDKFLFRAQKHFSGMSTCVFWHVSWKCRGQLVWFSRDVRKQWVKHIRLSLAVLLTGYHDLCNVFCVDVEWTESACKYAATACGNLPEEHSGTGSKNDSNAKLGPRSLACSFSWLVVWLLSDAFESLIRDTVLCYACFQKK